MGDGNGWPDWELGTETILTTSIKHTGILKKSFLWSVPQIIGWDDTGPFPLFHTPWHKDGRGERMEPFTREELKWQKAWKKE